MIKKLYPIFGLFFGISILVIPIIVTAQVTTQGGGTGSTSPSGILNGITGNLHLQTLKIGTGLTFNGTTLAASGGSSASTTLLGDSNTFSGTINRFTNAPAFTSLTGILKGNSTSAITAAVNGTDFTLLTANTCGAGQFFNSATAAGVLGCGTPAGTSYTGTYPIIVTGSVISSGYSTTTNSGMAQGFNYVGSGGIFQTAASSSFFGFTPPSNATTLTVAGTADQLTSSAGAQDLTANRTWTLSLPNHVIFPVDFLATAGTTTNATTTGSQYFTGITASRPLYVDSTGKLTSAGTGVSGNCVNWQANNTFGDAGSACGSGGGGASFGQALEVNSSNWLSATTTNTYGINANAQGLTYGYGIGDKLLVYASSTNLDTIFGFGAGGNNATTSATINGQTVVGFHAGSGLTTNGKEDNTAVGDNALAAVTTGSGNVAIGAQAMSLAVGGASSHTVIGKASGTNLGTNSANDTIIGNSSATNLTSGNRNIFLGSATGLSLISGSDNIAIGNGADFGAGLNPNNQIDIGNLLFGTNIYSNAVTRSANPVISGSIGIGSTTPFAEFGIHAVFGSAYPGNLLFNIASSSATATTSLFNVDNVGHQYTSGSTPTISGGTSSVSGNDNNGTITVTGTLLTSVTLTFANAWASAPDCTMADSSTGVTGAISSISTTQMVIGFSAGVNSGTVWYVCRGHR